MAVMARKVLHRQSATLAGSSEGRPGALGRSENLVLAPASTRSAPKSTRNASDIALGRCDAAWNVAATNNDAEDSVSNAYK